MSGTIHLDGVAIAFADGDTVTHVLVRARGEEGTSRLFCGIGQCQNCLVEIGGRIMEACLTPCRDGMDVRRVAVEPVRAGRRHHG